MELIQWRMLELKLCRQQELLLGAILHGHCVMCLAALQQQQQQQQQRSHALAQAGSFSACSH
jgi:hypothetical protein